jgi:NADPH:quinone reductase-like Zn-dependent oxidoreductase
MLRYSWVCPASELDTEGEDIHTSLAQIYELAETGVLKPAVRRIVPFDQAAEALPKPLRPGQSTSEEVVVQLVG